MKDIVITIPKKIKWEEYQKELDKVKDEKEVLNFKVTHLPKDTSKGRRCYIVYNDNIIGWMKISGLVEQEFTCSTTGKNWKGKFIQRTGKLNKINPIPMKGFRGFRYYEKIDEKMNLFIETFEYKPVYNIEESTNEMTAKDLYDNISNELWSEVSKKFPGYNSDSSITPKAVLFVMDKMIEKYPDINWGVIGGELYNKIYSGLT